MPPFYFMKKRNDEWTQMLTEMRQETGLSQKAASLAAGLSENYVANVERNRVSPTVRRLDKVLNVYGYELEVVKR